MSLTDNFISITELVELARSRGVDFGKGDPRVHLLYLAKLGLLPRAVKKKVDNRIEGHYPALILEKLVQIESLKKDGLSYEQIGQFLNNSADNRQFLSERNSRPFSSPALLSQFAPNFLSLFMLAAGVVLGFFLGQKNQAVNTEKVAVAQAKSVALTPTAVLTPVIVPQDQIGNNTVYSLSSWSEGKNFYKLGVIQLQ